MKLTGLLLLLICCLFAATSYAELIKYTDKDGTLCFADDISTVPKKYRKNIIRDEEESSVQTTDSRQKGSSSSYDNDDAIICYNGFLKSINGLDITHFIAARGYSSRLYDVTKNPEHKRLCADLYCRHNDGVDISRCMKDKLAEDTRLYYHFIIIRDNMILDTDPVYPTARNLIDKFYNIDPKTPYNFKQ